MRPTLLILLSLLLLDRSAQFKIYNTLEDLINKTSIDYPDHDLRSIKGESDTQLIIEHPVDQGQGPDRLHPDLGIHVQG